MTWRGLFAYKSKGSNSVTIILWYNAMYNNHQVWVDEYCLLTQVKDQPVYLVLYTILYYYSSKNQNGIIHILWSV